MPYETAKPRYWSSLSVGENPNHGCPLVLAPGQKMLTKGSAPCMISKVQFDFSQDVQESKMMKDRNGKLIEHKTWVVDGEDDG
jgi:hypothetical protein